MRYYYCANAAKIIDEELIPYYPIRRSHFVWCISFTLSFSCTDFTVKTMGSKGGSCVPVVDLSAFTSSVDIEQRKKTAKLLAECCRLNGCVGIIGHGVPMDLLERAFTMSQRLFSLPLEDKLKAPHPEGMTPHRGYSGVGREQGGAKGALDTEDQGTKDSLLKTFDYKVRFKKHKHI